MGILAELHGKLDPFANDPVERSEDLLTDAVFGAIRHLPRTEVLGRLLAEVGVTAAPKDLAEASVRLWPILPAAHGPDTYIEPDVVVVARRHVVVFEAKLHAQFGRYPDEGSSGGWLHQLAVQYAAVRSWAAGERLSAPIVAAVTAGAEPPSQDLQRAAADIERLIPEMNGSQPLRWLSWRSIARVLEGAHGLRYHEKQYVEDVLALMDKRGVRRVFEGFRPEDYWLISSAQRVAADRLYPQLRTFVEDLAAVLAEDGIGWTQPGAKWVYMSTGAALNKPVDWTRSYVGPMFWPEAWPRRTRLGGYLAIYVLFDFVEPALEVALTIPGPGVAVAQQKWFRHFEALISDIVKLPDSFEMALDRGDLARTIKTVNVKALDADWLGAAASAAVNTAHLRLRRRTDPLSITVQSARELVGSVREAAERCPALWGMLRATEYVVDEAFPRQYQSGPASTPPNP